MGVPAVPKGSREKASDLISNATVELLQQWDCINNVSGMVFDTTSANTGCRTAACIALQQDVNRFLLWFTCRHHIGKVVLTHVWDTLLVEVSKSPQVTPFQRFKAAFRSLESAQVDNLDLPNIPDDLKKKKEEIINLCHQYQQHTVSRGDYGELVLLVLLISSR